MAISRHKPVADASRSGRASVRFAGTKMPTGSKMLAGALAGCAATLPMSFMMIALNRKLPKRTDDPLPPEVITSEVADRFSRKVPGLGVRESVNPVSLDGYAVPAHFAYGAAAGALFPLVAKFMPGQSMAKKGIVYGLGVWLGSYLALMPKLGLYQSAKDEPARMNAIMSGSHVIWGAATGLMAGYLMKRRTEA